MQDPVLVTQQKTSLPFSLRLKKAFLRDWQLYLLVLPAVLYIFIFHYLPMYGVQIAFKDFRAVDGIMGSAWVGLKHFERFFSSEQFLRILGNTLKLSFGQLIVGFPMPIILALVLNQMRSKKFKKVIQTVTYAPHFISIVVLVGMMQVMLSPRTGVVTHLLGSFGVQPINYFADGKYFMPLYILSGVWQGMGWGSIIYLAALSSVSPELYEAAKVDGCSRWKLIWHIDIPSIIPTMVIMLILNVGQIMSVGFDKAYLMQNTGNVQSAEIISTYVYKVGLLNSQFSYSAAIGLFNSVVNIVLLVSVNTISKKLAGSSLW